MSSKNEEGVNNAGLDSGRLKKVAGILVVIAHRPRHYRLSVSSTISSLASSGRLTEGQGPMPGPAAWAEDALSILAAANHDRAC